MRFSHFNLNKFTLVSGIIFFGAVFALLSASIPKTFADNPDSNITRSSENHFVTIYDQGSSLTIKTNASTVEEALKNADIILGDSDVVEPGLSSAINADNFFINIYRAHPVIIIDGKNSQYALVSSYDPKTAIVSAGITIYDGDEIKTQTNNNFLEIGSAIVYKIIRNGGRTITVEEEIPFEEETVKDYDIGAGNTEVRQLGEVGLKTMIYEVQYIDGEEVSRKLVSEKNTKEPVKRIVAVGASQIEMNPLTPSKGRNRYTTTGADGRTIERQETFYDLDMSRVMAANCGGGGYSVREDGVKVDKDGYVIVAANLNLYPRCSIVETSLGQGKVYDTGTFAVSSPEQFDIATDWSKRDGI
ncbi:G5 domain-containing protein [Candidatus Saccharibacteria bacterium]|nr:G5 domain-containing protein [Candidatus Saccharibacteria bacterium]